MHRLQPFAFSMALLLVLPGTVSLIGGWLGFATHHLLSGLLGISIGALLISYGGWLGIQAGKHRFPNWIRDLHTMLHI
jgi:hypothetical protein